MRKPSEIVDRKFIDVIAVDDYEILTDTGWHDIKSINKTTEYDVHELQTKHFKLKCADNHIVFDTNGNEIFVKDLTIGQHILTEVGLDEVASIVKLNQRNNMYDIELGNDSDHRYYTNGILSHNSTIYCIYSLWLASFFPEKKIMILANKATTALELLSRISMGYEYLPHWIKPACLVYNKGELTFANMSSIRAFASSSDAARGFSANTVILDEFAFLQKNIADKLFTSMYPVISSSKNGKFIIVSTPNGTDNLYYDIWCQANSKEIGKNLEGWKPFEMFWYQVPGHDEAWKQRQIAAIGAQRFAQEFDNQFLAKGNDKKLIPDEVISKYRMKLSEYKAQGIMPKKQKIVSPQEDELFEFEMWHEFQPNKTYLASADISEGIGGDSSVLYIWDVTDLRSITMCARFSSNTTSLVQFAYIASKMLALYNNPWLAAERNGVSAGMLDSLRITYGYNNIIVDNKKREPGIYSHVQVKSKACLWAREMMTSECFGFILYDKDLLDEMALFIKKDTKGMHNIYHAMPGPNSHDDHMLALIWALYALSNDKVNEFFVVCETITTQIGVVYAQMLQPLNAYYANDIDKIMSDPLYKQFIEYKEEAMKKCKQAFDAMKREDQNDIFKYQSNDPYFGDNDDGSWNNTPLDWNMKPGFQQGTEKNIMLGGNGSSYMPSFYVS